MGMYEPDPTFERKLHQYDDQLVVRWCSEHPLVSGTTLNRWQIARKGRDGSLRHIMFVTEPDGGFRHPDDRDLAHLRRCDSFAYGGQDLSRFRSREFLNALGFKADHGDDFKTAVDRMADRRYYDWVSEFADKMAHLAKKNPGMFPDKPDRQEMKRLEAVAEAKAEVQEAYDKGQGIIAYDPKLKTARVVG